MEYVFFVFVFVLFCFCFLFVFFFMVTFYLFNLYRIFTEEAAVNRI